MGSAEEFGPYVVYEQLGLGGMATVHRAEAHGIAGFSKQVALKRMLPNVAADANLVKSFIREAQLASHLRHANVAQTYDLGKVGETYFIAMELVPGRNLRQILKHCAAHDLRLPIAVALNIVNQIADALDYAHNLCDETGKPLGIIHRDVSPSNVIVSEGGVVKLIDFGIAKAAGSNMHTMSGTVKGKFGYMAPEYLLGDAIDARADLFALGVLAHELLANRPLFQGRDDMDTLYRVRDMEVSPPSRFNRDVPPGIDTIILTALERDPDKRWQRANALRTALTTEIRTLGLIAHDNKVIDWVEWAFAQPRGDDTESPEISISEGTASRVPLDDFEVPTVADDEADAGWQDATNARTAVRPGKPHVVARRSAPPAARATPSQSITTPERRGSEVLDTDTFDPGASHSITAVQRPTPRPITAVRASQPHVIPRDRAPTPRAQPGQAPQREGASSSTHRDRPSKPPPAQPDRAPTSSRNQPSEPPPARLDRATSPGQRDRPSQPIPRQERPATIDSDAAKTALFPPSGARTAPRPSQPATIDVGDSAVLDEVAVGGEAAAAFAASTAAGTRADPAPAGAFLLTVLVLIAAGAAAAVVYFALP